MADEKNSPRELAARIRQPNSMPRRILIAVLGAFADNFMTVMREETWRELRLVELRDPEALDAVLVSPDVRRGLLDQLIIVASVEHNIVETEALCTRCVQEGIKVGAILIREQGSKRNGRTAAALRRYAETIAVVRDGKTVAEILHAIGA